MEKPLNGSVATVEERRRGRVLGVPIDAVSWETALDRILGWARQRSSRYVCICNAHVTVTAAQEPDFWRVVEAADMATPDGAPVAWMMRRIGFPGQARVNGPDLTWKLCRRCADDGVSVFFVGGAESTLDRLRGNLLEAFPGLSIAGMESPPFRPLTEDEDRSLVERINAGGAGVVFVGLGCPKQERWMAEHRGRVNGVMIGVGAAFDFHAGTVKRAPRWMQRVGLEWLHRLASEPGRLWRRYLVTNSLFVLGALRQLLGPGPRQRGER